MGGDGGGEGRILTMTGRTPARAAAAAALLLCPLLAGSAGARELSGNRTWSGELVVPKGETWTVRPGAAIRFRGGRWIVRGRLVVAGTAREPVRVEGDDAFEGIDFRGEDGSSVAWAVIAGGQRGVQVTNASVRFLATRWEKNGIGLGVEPYAKVRLDNCAFASPSRVGILVKRGGAAEVAGTRFEGAGKAGLYVYGAKDVSVRESRFERNAIGLHAAMAGSRAAVAASLFRENGTGVLAEKMAAPELSGCEISANDVGLRFTRRAEGTVSGSRIAENGEGVVVEHSSYPVFRGNAFRGNRRYAVRLANQSSEWEGELGDTDREFPGAAPFSASPGRRGDFRPGGEGSVPGPPGRKASLSGFVDFRGNDWGEPAGAVTPGGQVPGIHDAENEPTFEYKGKRYRMDRVLLK